MTKQERLDIIKRQIIIMSEEAIILEKEIEEDNKKFDWEKFEKGKQVINCRTHLEAEIFLAILHGRGHKWLDNEKLLNKNKWHEYEKNTCYKLGKDGLGFSPIDYFEDEGCQVIKFDLNDL